ncbi:MAG: STAS domain-containing protein [Flavobacteriales bacterium]|nr:STAS domain-containing protein [Flavobacteriales bacterium]
MTLNYNMTDEGAFGLITIHGKLLEPHDGKDLLDELAAQIEEGKTRFIVDMSDVPQMNSSGLNLMIRMLTKTRNNGGELIVVHLSDKVKELYLTTKLNAIFTICDTLEEAKDLFQKQTENI